MSYARFLEGDVYIIADTRGGYTCFWCSLMKPRQGRWVFEDESEPLHDMPNTFRCEKMTEMREHVIEHIRVGDRVPSRCLEEIDEDIANGSPYD